MTENEFILQDRLSKIRSVMGAYNDSEFYISFSGGKDSTVVHHLIDMALPNNKINRYFINTGIEYRKIKDFVKKLQSSDDRIKIVYPIHGIGYCLKRYGYPFKSKFHSDLMYRWQKNKNESTKSNYITGKHGKGKQIPKKLLYQYDDDFNLRLSDKCCRILKKDPAEQLKGIGVLGIRNSEGGVRSLTYDGCVFNDKKGNMKKFLPLFPISDEWVDWFIKEYNIELCELYNDFYNFKRTGCLGCPFNLKIQKDLDLLYEKLPNEYEKAIRLWKPVYDEYIRIGYRLKYYPHKQPKQINLHFEKDEGLL